MIELNISVIGNFPGVKEKLHAAVGKAMQSEGKKLQQVLRSHVVSKLNVKKQTFVTSFSAKVMGQDPNRLPGLRIRSRIPWMGIHEKGGSISGKMLIPINGRIGRKQFKSMVDELMRGGNAYFIRKGSKVIMMAENIKEHEKPLAGVKRRYRQAEGIKRLKRGADIPIAVLVPKVSIQKRLDVLGVVRGQIPGMMEAIGREIQKIS